MKRLMLATLGRSGLCKVFVIRLSIMRMTHGSSVTVPSTPRITPLLITMPRSRPSVKLIKQIATKPATVVRLLPTIEENVCPIAAAIASSRSLQSVFCSL